MDVEKFPARWHRFTLLKKFLHAKFIFESVMKDIRLACFDVEAASQVEINELKSQMINGYQWMEDETASKHRQWQELKLVIENRFGVTEKLCIQCKRAMLGNGDLEINSDLINLLIPHVMKRRKVSVGVQCTTDDNQKVMVHKSVQFTKEDYTDQKLIGIAVECLKANYDEKISVDTGVQCSKGDCDQKVSVDTGVQCKKADYDDKEPVNMGVKPKRDVYEEKPSVNIGTHYTQYNHCNVEKIDTTDTLHASTGGLFAASQPSHTGRQNYKPKTETEQVHYAQPVAVVSPSYAQRQGMHMTGRPATNLAHEQYQGQGHSSSATTPTFGTSAVFQNTNINLEFHTHSHGANPLGSNPLRYKIDFRQQPQVVKGQIMSFITEAGTLLLGKVNYTIPIAVQNKLDSFFSYSNAGIYGKVDSHIIRNIGEIGKFLPKPERGVKYIYRYFQNNIANIRWM